MADSPPLTFFNPSGDANLIDDFWLEATFVKNALKNGIICDFKGVVKYALREFGKIVFRDA